MKKPLPQIDDEDIDRFVTKFLARMNPALTAEERADPVYDFVVNYAELAEPEKSKK
jgi:hypothetical protein